MNAMNPINAIKPMNPTNAINSLHPALCSQQTTRFKPNEHNEPNKRYKLFALCS